VSKYVFSPSESEMVFCIRNPGLEMGGRYSHLWFSFDRNRLKWQAAGITFIYYHRWPGEAYYQEGRAEGLD
jgi:hypothetical protein